jgi:thioredoxin-dependent peroxiredoxin
VSLQLGDDAPDFAANATHGVLRLHSYLGSSWGVLFSLPGVCTAVGTTELALFAQLAERWAERDIKVIGVTPASVTDNAGWAADVTRAYGVAVQFPLAADEDGAIGRLYDLVHPKSRERAVLLFVIGPLKKIKVIQVSSATVGRNIPEVLRTVEALQLSNREGVHAPAGWVPGSRLLLPETLDAEAAAQRFGTGYQTVTPYLRLVAADAGRA